MNTTGNKVLVVGGGFGGLYAACELGRRKIPTVLIDMRNFHLFQPLLYQVATGFLSPGDIAAPLRTIVAGYPSVDVLQCRLLDLEPDSKIAHTSIGPIEYSELVLSCGLSTSYFGHDSWGALAPGMKSIEDALEVRRRIFEKFELAESSANSRAAGDQLNFVIVGGGPTGVELAGAIAELARGTLNGEFHRIDPRAAKITLFEGSSRILETFHPKSSQYAAMALNHLGVDIRTGTRVTAIRDGELDVSTAGGAVETVCAGAIIWAAGVRATEASKHLAQRLEAAIDKGGRIKVTPELAIPGHESVFVIGDLAAVDTRDGESLPGLAPVAMQEGRYVAKVIAVRRNGRGQTAPFNYRNRGNLAVIGRGRAVGEFGGFRLRGLPAWLAWAIVHIFFLIEFENKFVVFFRWAWNYLTNRRGSRLITMVCPPPVAQT